MSDINVASQERIVEDVGVVRGQSRRSARHSPCLVDEGIYAGTKGQAAATTVPKPSAPTSELSSLDFSQKGESAE